MARTKEKRHRRQLHDGSSDPASRSMNHHEALETQSMADAKVKLYENRHRILQEMGIAETPQRASIMTLSSDAEILRETVIEHKIQIPRKKNVDKMVMREVSVEETELVSEEVYDIEQVPTKVITVGRHSMLPTEQEDLIVEVPEIIVKKNFIEVRVPKVVERVVQVADETCHTVAKEVSVAEVEYVDEVVDIEEEYLQYVDIEVPEIVEVPNYIEIVEEKHVVRDLVQEINQHYPVPVELEHVVHYETPTLKPIYRDEYYTLNVPRIIQVPVFEDLLPEHHLDTLIILKERFDEMATMKDPVSMCFVEDYAVQAQETFQSVHVHPSKTSHPSISMEECHVPIHEPVVVPRNYDTASQSHHSHHDATKHIVIKNSSSSSSTSSNITTPKVQKSGKLRRGCCAPKVSTHSSHPLRSLAPDTKKSSRKYQKSNITTPSVNAHSGPQRIPRGLSSQGGTTMQSGPTYFTQMSGPSGITALTGPAPHHNAATPNPNSGLTPIITRSYPNGRLEKRSVDTDYVKQFVTNADPLNRHPPSAIVTEASPHDSNVRLPSMNTSVSHQPNSTVARSHSFAEINSVSASQSMYGKGAANHPAERPRMSKDGRVLISPPNSNSQSRESKGHSFQ